MAPLRDTTLDRKYADALSPQFTPSIVGAREYGRSRDRLASAQRTIDALLGDDEELILVAPTIRTFASAAGQAILTDSRVIHLVHGRFQAPPRVAGSTALDDVLDVEQLARANDVFMARIVTPRGAPQDFYFSTRAVMGNFASVVSHRIAYMRDIARKQARRKAGDRLDRRSADAHRLPPDVAIRMATFGRFEDDPTTAGIDRETVWNSLLPPLFEYASQDPAGFASDMRSAVLPVGGWAVYGASRCLWELLRDRIAYPDYFVVLDAGLEFLASLGRTPPGTRPYEMDRWRQTHGRG